MPNRRKKERNDMRAKGKDSSGYRESLDNMMTKREDIVFERRGLKKKMGKRREAGERKAAIKEG
jgi:hypothetical protein